MSGEFKVPEFDQLFKSMREAASRAHRDLDHADGERDLLNAKLRAAEAIVCAKTALFMLAMLDSVGAPEHREIDEDVGHQPEVVVLQKLIDQMDDILHQEFDQESEEAEEDDNGPALTLVTSADDAAISDMLALCGISMSPSDVKMLEKGDRDAAELWAAATHLRASDNSVKVPPKPAILPDAVGEVTAIAADR